MFHFPYIAYIHTHCSDGINSAKGTKGIYTKDKKYLYVKKLNKVQIRYENSMYIHSKDTLRTLLQGQHLI